MRRKLFKESKRTVGAATGGEKADERGVRKKEAKIEEKGEKELERKRG